MEDLVLKSLCWRPCVKRCRSAWRTFRELLPLLTCKAISLNTRGQMYNTCVTGTMLYSSECWALKQEDKKRLKRSERATPLWMCNIKKEETVSINSLLSRLNRKTLDSVFSETDLVGSEMWSEVNCILKWKEIEVAVQRVLVRKHQRRFKTVEPRQTRTCQNRVVNGGNVWKLLVTHTRRVTWR